MSSADDHGDSGHICPIWVAYTFDNPLRFLIHQPGRMLRDHVRQGSTALDLGCGLGFFSIGMAKLVGNDGRVIAADVQQGMLDVVEKRARRAGLAGRIRTHLTAPDSIGVDAPVDFVLASWMVHESPDIKALFEEIASMMKSGARLLVIEPRSQVSEEAFEESVALALASGFRLMGRPRVSLSHAALFEHAGALA